MAKSGSLTARQRRAIAALLTAKDVKAAAQDARVGYRTLRTWLDDPAFCAALTAAQDAALSGIARRMIGSMGSALDTLEAVQAALLASPAARVSAARAVLENGVRLSEIVDLAGRVAELEAVMTDEQDGGVG